MGSEQWNWPTTGVWLERAMPVSVPGAGADLSPVISTYWKPWNVNRGVQVSSPWPAQM